MKDRGPFAYKICGLDRIVDEKGSSFVALRKIAWNTDPSTPDDEVDEAKIKLDLRKYYTSSEGEVMNKGVSFLTEEGPNELVRVLLEEGYGDTGECLVALKNRENFKQAISFAYDLEPKEDDDEFYDPRELLKLTS